MIAIVRGALLSLSLLVLGCGGGGTTGPITVTLFASSSLSGHSYAQGDYVNTSGLLAVGDIISQQGFGEEGMRAYLSFDHQIPAGAQVISATLRVYQSYIGNGPYPTLGDLVVDQAVYGNVLDAGAYGRTFPSNQGLGPLSTDATLETKSADVTDAVALDVATARTQSQFRLRFTVESNSDGGVDYVLFTNAGNPSPSQPTLVVTYQP
jgi:hypothetical protein